MKRLTALRGFALISAAALTVGLAACTSTPTPQSSEDSLSGSIRVTFGTGSQQAPMDEIVKAFEAANPGTKVNVNYLPANTITQSVLTELRAGNGPDVFYSNGGTGQAYSILPLAEAGSIAELDGPWTSTLPDAVRPLYESEGKVYGLPLAQVVIGMIYNKDLISDLDLDLPTEFSDLTELCAAAKDNGTSGIIVAGTVALNIGVLGQAVAASYVYSQTPDWNTQRADGSVTFADTPGWKDAMDAIVTLKNDDCFTPGAEGAAVPQALAAMATDQATMIPGPAGAIDAIKEGGGTSEYGVIPFPGPTSEDTRALVGYTDALAVNAKSTNLPLAKAFIDFFAEDAQAKIYADGVSAISLSDASAGVVPDAVSDYGPYLKDGRVVGLPNQGWPNADVNDAFATGIQGLITGQTTPEQVLEAMDAAWDK